MWIPRAHDRLARQGAAAIHEAFQEYDCGFLAITRRARVRFENRDWRGMQQDALERLELYGRVISRVVATIRGLLDAFEKDKKLWAAMKSAYIDRIARREDIELAETFFNSVSRRIFTTIGVDPRIEFLSSDFDTRPHAPGTPIYRSYPVGESLPQVVEQMLAACEFQAPFEDLRRNAQGAARAILREQRKAGAAGTIDAIDMIPSVFYRNQGAYLVGRIRSGAQVTPLTLALHHEPGGIVVDAVLLSADEVSIIFSFTRSYFHVEVEHRATW